MYAAFYTAIQSCCEGHKTRKNLVKHSIVLTHTHTQNRIKICINLNDFQFIALM